MKKLILGALMISGMAFTAADSFADEAGLNAASDLCSRIYLDSHKMDCLKIVGHARYFSRAAVGVCSRMYLDSDKLRCLKPIANQMITDSEAKICGEWFFDSDKTNCLGAIDRPHSEQTTCGHCHTGLPDQEAGLNAAANLCSQIYLDSPKMDCLKIVGSARYFSRAAIDVCSQMYLDSNKLECLASTANRLIVDSEAEFCGGMYIDSKKTECLKTINRPF